MAVFHLALLFPYPAGNHLDYDRLFIKDHDSYERPAIGVRSLRSECFVNAAHFHKSYPTPAKHVLHFGF
jgi:hypothetical protein